ncbi:MAG: hypothetical protein E7160_02385 [Firmicutes bacterium]|nr:hypothetical protein [Bacillota bacterium]
MIKINNIKFEEKFTEINIRHRLYEEKNYITLIINTEFYPALYKDNVVTGAIEAKIDIEGIKSLDELQDKLYNGDIGSITVSVNNDGVWEHNSYDNFKLELKDRTNRKLKFKLTAEDLELSTTGTLVSLYTTSTSRERLLKEFNLDDFYDKSIIREVGNNKIYKYFTKE